MGENALANQMGARNVEEHTIPLIGLDCSFDIDCAVCMSSLGRGPSGNNCPVGSGGDARKLRFSGLFCNWRGNLQWRDLGLSQYR